MVNLFHPGTLPRRFGLSATYISPPFKPLSPLAEDGNSRVVFRGSAYA